MLSFFSISDENGSKSATETSSEDSSSEENSSSSEPNSDSENSSSDEEDESEGSEKRQSDSEKSSYEIIEDNVSNDNIKDSKMSVRSTTSDGENKVDVNEESRATSTASEASESPSDTETESTSQDSEESDSSTDENFSLFSEALDKETTTITMEKDAKRKKKVRKRFTLPFIFNYLAWISCLGVIFVSVFYLWAYGVMFGNDKTYQWLTSLLAYFWSDLLIVEPLKVTFNNRK